MLVDKFVSPYISHNYQAMNVLNSLGKQFHYSSRGRWALYHCLKAYKLEKISILIPAFICPTILEPLKILKINPIFYDIDIRDLNPNIHSIQALLVKYPEIKVLLVASMYGNPAAMEEIEKIAINNSIILIDDAAQSFGATLNNKAIGTFGDCGFFSFSPGKPTVAHMGAYFWTNTSYQVPYTSHKFIHLLIYIDFYFNRYKTYTFNKYKIFKLLKISRLLLKIFDIRNDNIEKFEIPLVGGVINQLFKKNIQYRTLWLNEISTLLEKNNAYRLIKSIRGTPSPHKLVIVSEKKYQAILLLEYLKEQKIYCQLAYKSLTNDFTNLSNFKRISSCILEIPIDPNEQKMHYLKNKLQTYMDNYNDFD